jgi:hypothetical protein
MIILLYLFLDLSVSTKHMPDVCSCLRSFPSIRVSDDGSREGHLETGREKGLTKTKINQEENYHSILYCYLFPICISNIIYCDII